MRQVPDHQECWQQVDADGTASASGAGSLWVVELLDRQSSIPDDDAAAFFFQDLADANGVPPEARSFVHVTIVPPIVPTAEPAPLVTSPQVVVRGGIGRQYVAVGKDVDAAGNARAQLQAVERVQTQLCVLRLPKVETDLLVTWTEPVPPGGDIHHHPEAFSETFQAIVDSLCIRDWSLFGQ